MLVHSKMHRNQWHLCLGVYKNNFIQHTYHATPPIHFGVYNTLSLVCLCKQSLNPLAVTNRFCLDTLECCHSWFVYTVHSTLTKYGAGHQFRAIYSSIYYSWMSQEWTTLGHSTPHGLKKFQSSPVVWGPHSERWRRTLSLAWWRGMYGEATPSPGKHQWYSGWIGHFVYCTIRM